jgi:hypothetical protein
MDEGRKTGIQGIECRKRESGTEKVNEGDSRNDNVPPTLNLVLDEPSSTQSALTNVTYDVRERVLSATWVRRVCR